MGKTLAKTISDATKTHLTQDNGLLFGQCVTAVGWVGGTIPELTEEQGIVELSMADVAGSGIAVGAALMGRRPIYVIRYQGFMWYNAAPLLNYAAKSKEMWGVPCPILVRSIAMEGAIGPVASSAQHSMVMRMPGMPVCAPMTPKEWLDGWNWFKTHDDPLYMSEHRRGFTNEDEMQNIVHSDADVTIVAISAARLNAIEAIDILMKEGIKCNLIHQYWLKPFKAGPDLLNATRSTKLSVVIDADFELCGASRSIAYELMHETGKPVFALGVADKTAGFAPHLDNGTPSAQQIVDHVKAIYEKEIKSPRRTNVAA